MLMRRRWLASIICLLWGASALMAQPGTARWTEKQANDWYAKQPWLVGANYSPASAINQLEMWQADTFDPKRIDLELGWAANIGMNTMRVYLHDLLWQQDAEGLRQRMEMFLKIAAKHNIRPMFVLFDSVWDPDPRLGQQRAPKPGVHNSGWVQSPGRQALTDPSQYARLEAYVKGVVSAFAHDRRVLAWDVWNEPENLNGGSIYGKSDPPNKTELVVKLLQQTFAWVRAARPSQPVTAGVWQGDWSSHEGLSAANKLMLELSDIVTFHNYEDAAEFEKRVRQLQRYKRPLLCTEYMARGNKSTFEGSLTLAKKHNVGAYNWGLVQGKTQTHLPWDSWQKPYVDREPSIWFHEVFRNDGTPYRQEEVDLIRRLTGRGTRQKAA
jgi:hypothetical protein